jgi:hypothetical protein
MVAQRFHGVQGCRGRAQSCRKCLAIQALIPRVRQGLRARVNRPLVNPFHLSIRLPRMRTFSLAMALSLASVLAAPAAQAAGFGPGPGSVPMGSPLVALPVLLDEGDVLELDASGGIKRPPRPPTCAGCWNRHRPRDRVVRARSSTSTTAGDGAAQRRLLNRISRHGVRRSPARRPRRPPAGWQVVGQPQAGQDRLACRWNLRSGCQPAVSCQGTDGGR